MLDYKDYVYAAYVYRNFSKAAREVHVSQPWFSSAIKKTEQELDLQLFDRSTNPISLTEAGKYYIQQVERIYAIEEEMRKHFEHMRANTGEKLRIGSSMFFCTYVLPELMQDFCDQLPEVKLVFSEGRTQRLVEKLFHGDVDIIFEVEPIDEKKVKTIAWGTEEVVLAVPSWYEINDSLSDYKYTFKEFVHRDETDHHKPAVSLEKFREEPFLILSEGNDMHQRSLQMCRNAGFAPDIRFTLDQLMTSYYMTCEGQGVSFIRSAIPEHVVATDNVVFYRIDDELATRNVYYSYLDKDMPEVLEKLIMYLESDGNYIYGGE